MRTRKIAIESIQVQSGFRMVRTGSFPDSEAENPPWLPRWPTAALSASGLISTGRCSALGTTSRPPTTACHAWTARPRYDTNLHF